jgi:hypothetical protein
MLAVRRERGGTVNRISLLLTFCLFQPLASGKIHQTSDGSFVDD